VSWRINPTFDTQERYTLTKQGIGASRFMLNVRQENVDFKEAKRSEQREERMQARERQEEQRRREERVGGKKREREREREKEIRKHAKTLKLWTRFSKEPYIRGNANNRDSRPYVETLPYLHVPIVWIFFFSMIFYLKYSIVYSIQRSYDLWICRCLKIYDLIIGV